MTLGSSDSDELSVTDGETVKDANAASSPANEGAETTASLADVLAKAIAPEEKPAEGTPPDPTKGEQTGPEGEKPDDKPTELTEEEVKQLPFHEHPRWKQIYTERNDLRTEVETLREENEVGTVAAESLGKIQGFLEQNQLSGEDFDRGLTLMAQVRNSPDKALEFLVPLVQSLQERTGKALPADLQKEVDELTMTQERAAELAKLRRETGDRKAIDEKKQADDAVATRRATLERAAAAVSVVERGWMNSDTDYAKVADRVALGYKAWLQDLVLAGKPLPTEKEAVDKATELRTAEMASLAKLLPKQTKTPNPKPPQSSATTPSTAQPKSLKDALAAAIMK